MPLHISGLVLDIVPSHKVLGLILSDTLQWNENINKIVAEASKRLYILPGIIGVLKRAGISPYDLLHISELIFQTVATK